MMCKNLDPEPSHSDRRISIPLFNAICCTVLNWSSAMRFGAFIDFCLAAREPFFFLFIIHSPFARTTVFPTSVLAVGLECLVLEFTYPIKQSLGVCSE